MFLGGLKPDLSDDDIRTHFEQFGTIIDFEMLYNKKKERKTFGFITFEREETMKELIKKGQEMIGEFSIDLKEATPKQRSPSSSAKPAAAATSKASTNESNRTSRIPKGTDDNTADDRKLFIGSLSQETSEPQLKSYFEAYGEVESVNLKLNRKTGASRCFAFIVFKETKSINKVFKAHGGHVINSKKVEVKRAQPLKMVSDGSKPDLREKIEEKKAENAKNVKKRNRSLSERRR